MVDGYERKQPVILIVGPTAVGKTALSLYLAERLQTEIVSSDSRQVYRYMNIGTAKPGPAELARVPHHFIDIKNPDEYYSSGMYGEEARQVISDLHQRNLLPIIVGGSGLYIRALIDGFDDVRCYDIAVQEQLRQELDINGLGVLYRQLQQVDPVTALRLHPNDTQRILRALEVWRITKRPLSDFHRSKPSKPDFSPILIGLTMDRHELYKKIEIRVDEMIAAGLIEEVEYLQQRGYHESLRSLKTVGYQEVFAFLAGRLHRDEMISQIKQRTRNYAKRQFTWFNKDKRIRWYEVDNPDEDNYRLYQEIYDKLMNEIADYKKNT